VHELNDALASVKGQQNVSTPRHTLQLAPFPDKCPQIATIYSTEMVRRWLTAFHPPCSFLCELA